MGAVTSARPAVATWPTLVVLAVLWLATIADQVWVFGVLFLLWAAWDISAGESYFLSRIRRRDNPVTFWAVELSWIGFGLAWILAPS